MHILSELRNPLFDAPNRQRALRALQMSRILKENNSAKAWQAVKNMIDKAVSEHNLSPRTQTQNHNSYISPQLPSSTSLPIDTTSNSNTSVYPAMGTVPTYAYQNPSRPYEQQQQTLPTQSEQIRSLSQPQPPILQSMQTTQDHAPCWDDMYETPTRATCETYTDFVHQLLEISATSITSLEMYNPPLRSYRTLNS
jgi:hypothetical protein